MRVPALIGTSILLLSAVVIAARPVASEAHAVRPLTPWAPPEWHPAPEALAALPSIDGHADAKLAGVHARAAFVYDLDRGEVLYERRADEALPIASLTKLISSLALESEHPDLDATYCVDQSFWPSRSGAKSKLSTGDCYRGWDFLGAALVASDNRGAFGLQVVSGLDFSSFVQRMDDVADELGMSRSSFADPSGLEDENLSTARDVARAVIAVAAHPELSLAATAPSWTLQRADRDTRRTLFTTDKILGDKNVEVLAAKTGYSGTAGYCFAAVVRTSSGRTLVVSLLNANRSADRWADVRKLIRTFGE